MPSELIDDRLALDETSLDFRGLPADALEQHLDRFNASLHGLHQQGLTVRCHPWLWELVECLDGCVLCDFVFQVGGDTVSPDTLRLLGILLDRCRSWEEGDPGFPATLDPVAATPVTGEDPIQLAPALSLRLVLARHRTRAMACLVFGGCPRRGAWSITDPAGDTAGRIHFFADPAELPDFWRSLYAREQIPERQFFALAEVAFPALIFHPDLDFGRFEGPYIALRDRVATILGGLNDHFAGVLAEESGIPKQVSAALGRFGIDLSPESSKTRSSPKLMALREVTLDGTRHRVEWHAKLTRGRNRIHFSLPIAERDGRILIGIFDRHLDT